LRNAVITEDEEIEIHTFCGGVELFVPQTVNVMIKSRSFIGSVGNHASRNVDKETPCLHIIADNFLGGVDIKNK
jgi:predicted membrane protein